MSGTSSTLGANTSRTLAATAVANNGSARGGNAFASLFDMRQPFSLTERMIWSMSGFGADAVKADAVTQAAAGVLALAAAVLPDQGA
jgi:hypothetical protein